MLKAAGTCSILESWLDGVLICKWNLIFWKFCVEIQHKSRKIYSAFSYVYFKFIARPANNQQGDFYNGFLFNAVEDCLHSISNKSEMMLASSLE